MQEVRDGRAFKYKRQFYSLAIILLTILFVYFLHVALYHCPKQNNNVENIYTRKGKYLTKPPPLGQATWEDVKREKATQYSFGNYLPWTLRKPKNLIEKL